MIVRPDQPANNRSVLISIRVPRTLDAYVADKAAYLGMSKSDLYRRFIEEGALEEHGLIDSLRTLRQHWFNHGTH